MSENKITKVACGLKICGTQKADAVAKKDLSVPDPDPSVGEALIKGALGEETKDASRQRDS